MPTLDPGDGLLSPLAYGRDDEAADDRFYAFPRKVVHLDDEAIAALGRLYAEALPKDGRLLDLMSSWRSHVPEGGPAREIVGLGLNAEEMTDNPQLTHHVVHDVNQDPHLPFGDDEFDGAPASRASNATTAARFPPALSPPTASRCTSAPRWPAFATTQRVAAQASSAAAGNLCSGASR